MSENTQVRQALWDAYFRADTGTLDGDRMIADIATLTAENARLREDAERFADAIDAVSDLIDNSKGVYGLHLNGNVAPWGELRTGGRYEEWLLAFDAMSDTAPEQVRP